MQQVGFFPHRNHKAEWAHLFSGILEFSWTLQGCWRLSGNRRQVETCPPNWSTDQALHSLASEVLQARAAHPCGAGVEGWSLARFPHGVLAQGLMQSGRSECRC